MLLVALACRTVPVVESCRTHGPESCVCAADEDCWYYGAPCSAYIYCTSRTDMYTPDYGCPDVPDYAWPDDETCACVQGECRVNLD